MSGTCGLMSIGPPVPILTLPKRLNADTDRILAGRGYAIRRSHRRKSVEVPFTVDGQSLSIYNVGLGRLVVSYPFSPRTRFLSHPLTVSACTGDSGHRTVYTYAVYQDTSGRGDEGKIQCFAWDSKKSVQPHENATAGGAPLKLGPHATIVSIEPLPKSSSQKQGFDILLFFSNGDLKCFSHDLREEHWQMNLFSMIPELNSNMSTTLAQLHLLELPLLKQSSWFKRLPGGADMIQTHNTKDINSSVLGLVTTNTLNNESAESTSETIHILGLQQHKSSSSSLRPTLQYIHTSRLPDGSSTKGKSSMNLGAGLIYRLTPQGFISKKLNCNDSREIKLLPFTAPEQSQMIPISDAHVLLLNDDELAIYDVKYGSKQKSATTAMDAVKTGSKRKKDEDMTMLRGLILLDYFKQSNIALAIHESQVFSISLQSTSQNLVKRKRPSSLSMSMGRGFEESSKLPQAELLEFTQRLDGAAQRKDHLRFEKIFFDAVASCGDSEQTDIIAACAITKLLNNSTHDIGLTSGTGGKHLAPFPKAVFQWLLSQNYLNETNTNQCMHRYASAPPSLSASGIIDSTILADPSLGLLATYIFYSRPLPLQSLLRSVVAILRSYFEAMDIDNHDDDDVMSKASPDKALELAEQAADQDLSKAVSLLTETPSISRGHALKLCVNQLAVSYNISEVSRAMRAQMTTRDLTMLIELLRTEIADAGWASHCLDVYPAQPEAVESQNEALAAICRLLDCCLDALGAGGWLGGLQTTRPTVLGEDEDNSDLIASLRSEASTALETVQESTFLHGFLRDFFRFDRAFQQSVSHASKRGDWAKYPKLAELYSAKNPALPLGLDTIQHIRPVKIGAGGEIKKRTKRDIGQTISKSIGKYTFEKIIL